MSLHSSPLKLSTDRYFETLEHTQQNFLNLNISKINLPLYNANGNKATNFPLFTESPAFSSSINTYIDALDYRFAGPQDSDTDYEEIRRASDQLDLELKQAVMYVADPAQWNAHRDVPVSDVARYSIFEQRSLVQTRRVGLSKQYANEE